MNQEYINTEPIPKIVWFSIIGFFTFIVIGYYYYTYERDGVNEDCLTNFAQAVCKQGNSLLYFIFEKKEFSCYSSPQSLISFPDEILKRCNLKRGLI